MNTNKLTMKEFSLTNLPGAMNAVDRKGEDHVVSALTEFDREGFGLIQLGDTNTSRGRSLVHPRRGGKASAHKQAPPNRHFGPSNRFLRFQIGRKFRTEFLYGSRDPQKICTQVSRRA